MHIREHGHDESKVQCVRFFQNVALRQKRDWSKEFQLGQLRLHKDGHNFVFNVSAPLPLRWHRLQ